eukprot:5602629-Amphidinium_carterae.1
MVSTRQCVKHRPNLFFASPRLASDELEPDCLASRHKCVGRYEKVVWLPRGVSVVRVGVSRSPVFSRGDLSDAVLSRRT